MNAVTHPAPGALERAKKVAYEAVFQKFEMPAFPDVGEERQHRKERLAGGFRIFADLGFSEGVSGHITARDPEFPETFWVNPFGMHFSEITASDLIRVDAEGHVVEGRRQVNVAAFAIHSEVYRARPDVVAAAHAHSVYGKAWSAVGRLLTPITQDACAFYEDHAFFDDTRVLVTEEGEAKHLARTLGSHKAAITVGRTIEEAVWWFISMEHCCQTQFLVEGATPNPLQIDEANARATRAVNGTPFAGWFQCQPMWDRIVRQQPDLLS
jgi:ribulose-5-phosphate 4-epimerase/fuculose-1-phosphate aldolase